MNSKNEPLSKKNYFVINNYNNLKYENKVNIWLDQHVETNVGLINKTNEDIVEDFFNKTINILEKNNLVIYNLNSFKDEIINFVYKHSL